MSSILKALKKLEQETRERETEPTPAMGMNIRPEQNRWKERTGPGTKKTPPWAWIISLSLVFIGAGGLLIIFSHDPAKEIPVAGPGAMTPVLSQKAGVLHPFRTPPVPVIPQAEEPGPGIAAAVAPQPPAPAIHGGPSQVTATTVHGGPSQVTATAVHGGPSQLTAPAVHGEPSQPPATAIRTVKPPPSAPPIHGAAPPPPNTAVQESSDNGIPVLDDKSLTINAISWSREPGQRLAVINSTIVREGQAVAGFQLVKIEEDQVIVQGTHKKWRVKFRLR